MHSVVQEFDYTDPFAASLRAFNLRGELLLGTANFGATELAVEGVGPHVKDRWCDPRPPQLDYRSIDSSGDHSDYDPFESDTSWLMQISESSPPDICCQQLLEQRLQELEDHSVENVRICCHGLSGSSVGSRYFVLEHAKLTLKQAVRQNWPEFHDAACKLYFVHPQPQDTLRPSWRTCVHIIVEFVDGRTACPIGAVPTLEESAIWDAHGNSNVRHIACYYLQQLHNRDVVSKFDHLCVRASFRCIVRAEGYRLHPDETTTIAEGALVQLHALPQVSATPIEFADYFWHGDPFLEAGCNLLGHWVSPQITWSFHVLTEEGYLGHRDYSPHASELQSIDHVATVMYHLWNLQTPGALAFTGLIHIGDRSTLHFLGFPVDSDQVPGLVWCDVGLVAPLVTALWLPMVSTVEDFRQALELGDRIPESSTIAVQTDGLQYLPDDRFKPRIGRLFFLRPVLQVDEDEVAFLQQETAIKIPSPVASDEELDLCATDGVGEPPKVQVRPNPEIRLAFDQDIPITRRTSEGEVVIGRVIPPPRWEENSVNRAAVAAGAQFRTDSGQLTVQFRSWLVKHDNRQAAFGQSRDFTLRAQLVVRVREKLKRVWNDHIGHDDTLQVHIVSPAPFTEPGAVGVLHIIAEVNRRPRSPLYPVLVAARELASLSISRPLWRAGLLPRDFDTEAVFDLCLPVCERHQLLVPVGGATRAWMGPRRTRRAHSGLFIPIWWDERLSVEEAANLNQGGDDNDESDFMQRATSSIRPSISPNLVGIRLLGLHQTSSLIQVDTSLPLLDQVAARWPFLHRTYDDLETLHEVGSPPSFVSGPSERLFLMQFRDDRFEQVHEDDVLILLTIKFHAPHTSNHQKQKVKVLWGPRHSTRDQFIGFVRMRWFCHRPAVLCFLNYNNQIWGELDTTRREFFDGDHIRLQVRSEREDWCDFEHAEITSRNLRIWEDSPPPDPLEDSPAASDPSRSRSRSREFRGVDQADTPFHSLLQHSVIRWTTDAVEYRPNDSGVESDDRSLPLIQTGVQRRLRQQGLSSAVDPHVFDRWCVKQSEASPGGTPASDSDLNPGSVSASPLPHTVTVPKLICLDSRSFFALPLETVHCGGHF